VQNTVQVAYNIQNERTRKREIAALVAVGKKTNCSNLLLLTDHTYEDVTQEGYKIAIRPAYDYLLHDD